MILNNGVDPVIDGRDGTGRVALFMFPIIQFYLEMSPVALHMQTAGWRVQAIFGWKDKSSESYIDLLRQSGVNAFYLPAELCGEGFGTDRPSEKKMDKEARSLKRLVLGLPVIRQISTISTMYRFHRQGLAYARRLLSTIRPTVVFDGPFWGAPINQAIGIEAKKTGLLYCQLPVFSILGEREFSIRFRLKILPVSLSGLSRLASWMVIKMYPSLARTYEGRCGLPHHPVKLIIGLLTGNREINPWKVPSELYDIIFVEAEHVRQNLISEGYNQETVVTSGKPSLDAILCQARRAEDEKVLMQRVGLDVGQSFILAYFPPYAEHGILSWNDHDRMFSEFINSFRAMNRPVVLSLHPAAAQEYYRKLAEKCDFLRVASENRLIEYYPLADCVVLPILSTTLDLMAHFDIPVVAYNFVGLADGNDGSLKTAISKGAVLVGTTGELTDQLEKCLSKPKSTSGEIAISNCAKIPACTRIVEEVQRKLISFAGARR